MCTAYNQLYLAHEWDQSRFEAWCSGKTGLSDGGRGDAGSCCYWMDQLPDESDGGVLCVLPAMAGWRKISDSLARLFLEKNI